MIDWRCDENPDECATELSGMSTTVVRLCSARYVIRERDVNILDADAEFQRGTKLARTGIHCSLAA